MQSRKEEYCQTINHLDQLDKYLQDITKQYCALHLDAYCEEIDGQVEKRKFDIIANGGNGWLILTVSHNTTRTDAFIVDVADVGETRTDHFYITVPWEMAENPDLYKQEFQKARQEKIKKILDQKNKREIVYQQEEARQEKEQDYRAYLHLKEKYPQLFNPDEVFEL